MYPPGMARGFHIATLFALFVVIVSTMRAYRRGPPENHITSRLSAALVLLLAADTAVRYLDDPLRVPAYLVWVSAFGALTVGVFAATGRFHAPPR